MPSGYPLPTLLLVLILGFPGCQPTVRETKPALYWWQTTLTIDPKTTDYLHQLGTKKLYVKCLDIGIDPQKKSITPLSMLHCPDTVGLTSLTIVPCVFLTNAVFTHTTPEQIHWLADRTAQVIQEMEALTGRTSGFQEVQIDCDWTATTEKNYFAYLKALGQKLSAPLAATIRLHQYKNPQKTGVPPVSRGMLMLYNTGNIENPRGGHSLFDSLDARVYLDKPHRYPLPLDLALPLFSWALIYRDETLWKIIADPGDRMFADTGCFVLAKRQNGLNYFTVRRNTYRSGHYLRIGDQIRVEYMDETRLIQAARTATRLDLSEVATVAFFQSDTAALRIFPPSLIRQVCHILQQRP
jgi:hypothetical protein